MSGIITLQTASIGISFMAAGGIATMSLFDIPEMKSQPASRALPMIRWLFSRGSHIMPQAAFISSAGFAALAYTALPPLRGQALDQILQTALKSPKVQGYLAAAALDIGIAAYTGRMIPNNFALIALNEEKGGSRSAQSAKDRGGGKGAKNADDSVGGFGQANEFKDLSGPQEKTLQDSTKEEERKVREMLDVFARQNLVRAALMMAGGTVGLVTALV